MAQDTAEGVERVLGRWRARQGSLAVRLTGAIREAIVTGDLWWGRRLPAERSLAVTLGVSRSTVVEAYDRLRGEGWLESRRGSGTFVSAAATAGGAAQQSSSTNAIFNRMIEHAGPRRSERSLALRRQGGAASRTRWGSGPRAIHEQPGLLSNGPARPAAGDRAAAGSVGAADYSR